ncbi:phosphatidate cytidylyltransferase [Adlercreutzia equolifaciens]|nr:phosphatidate cytidylyltransferase [Adlercreutzia equolifaciens]MDE8701697.1 phosphatidate cytidylyltransferase [Adlercreutzia equolifaciens]
MASIFSPDEKKSRARQARERLRRSAGSYAAPQDPVEEAATEEVAEIEAFEGDPEEDFETPEQRRRREAQARLQHRLHGDKAPEAQEDEGLPPLVCDPETAPAGPPWHYDLSEEEAQQLQEKRETRAEKRNQLKQKALDKTPQKLKNPSDLQVRFRTGVVYTAVTVICVLAGNIPMVLMLMAVAGICAGEFFYMLRSDAKLPNEMLGIIAAVLYPASVYVAGLVGAMIVSLALLLALLVWYVFWLRARIPDVGVSFFGAAYTGLLLCGLVVIRVSLPDPWGGVMVLLLFLGVWANDAFAYLVGSKIGKHKLAPRTSPKKSWEGFIAGLVGSVLFWCAMTFVPGVTMSILQAVIFGLIAGAMGVLGDLAESRIKRNSGFKDSGTIMPGHGGLLDRSDSLFLTSITAAILLVVGGCIPYALF